MRARIAALALGAVLASSSGCFTGWAVIRIAGYPGAPREGVHEEHVPLPGLEEKLVVSLSTADHRVTCKAEQRGHDAAYRASYRYGGGFKKAVAFMAIAELLLSGAFYLESRDATIDVNRQAQLLGAGFFAFDAVGSAALLFIPRKELFEREEVAVTTPVRDACPDGLAVEIAGDSFPVDAAGSLGDLGNAALDAWLHAQTSSLVVTYAGQSTVLPVAPTIATPATTTTTTASSSAPELPSSELSVPVGTFALTAPSGQP